MTLQGHPRSLILAPIESAYMTSLDLSSNLGPLLPRFRDIRAFVRQKPLFRYPSPIAAKISGILLRVDPWCWVCGEWRPRLTNREIILTVSYSNLCVHGTSTSRTDRYTNGRLAVTTIPRSA